MRDSTLQAKPHNTVPALKRMRLATKRIRLPTRPVSQPVIGISRVWMISEMVRTHWI
jgi:hypothetical protein